LLLSEKERGHFWNFKVDGRLWEYVRDMLKYWHCAAPYKSAVSC